MNMTWPLRCFAFVLSAALLPATARAETVYPLPPEATLVQGVPQGKVTKFTFTSVGKIFPGTVRDYWVYVPAQYNPKQPAPFMVFQDGESYVSDKGSYRVPIVFDNLIANKEIPPMVGIFVNPGVLPPVREGALARYNRSVEYDGLGKAYVEFLNDELLAEVRKTLNLSKDPAAHAIAGASSGAIAAFTAAWERPDLFTRVFSTIGTYVGLRGGDEYATLVRKSEPKPIRVFLQDGSADLNIYAGDWWMANQDMLTALTFSGYEVKHAWGDGGHSGPHGGAVFPDALRWLWKGYPAAPKAGVESKQPLLKLLDPSAPWELVGEGYGFTEGPAINAKGELFFSDIPKSLIYRVSAKGKPTVFATDTGGSNGLMFGPDGLLYAAQNEKRRIVSYDVKAKETVIAEDLGSNDIAVSFTGNLYVSDPKAKKVWVIPKLADGFGPKQVVDEGLAFPNGVVFSPDQTLLYVTDMNNRHVYSYQIKTDGTLSHKEAFCYLHLPAGSTESNSAADGVTVDTDGNLYVATRMGLQVCDQTGRVQAIIRKPSADWFANVVFGGADRNVLYATAKDKVWKRKTLVKGSAPFESPTTSAKPRL